MKPFCNVGTVCFPPWPRFMNAASISHGVRTYLCQPYALNAGLAGFLRRRRGD